jgi:hypothetical protein
MLKDASLFLNFFVLDFWWGEGMGRVGFGTIIHKEMS